MIALQLEQRHDERRGDRKLHVPRAEPQRDWFIGSVACLLPDAALRH